MFPLVIENTKILKHFRIEYIVLFSFIFSANSLKEEDFKKSLIYISQYKETLYLGFLFLFVLFFLIELLFNKNKSFDHCFKNVCFIREAESNYENKVYLLNRERHSWIKY